MQMVESMNLTITLLVFPVGSLASCPDQGIVLEVLNFVLSPEVF